MFDLSRYIAESTEKSGVPVKVEDASTLMNVASQLSTTTSKSIEKSARVA